MTKSDIPFAVAGAAGFVVWWYIYYHWAIAVERASLIFALSLLR